MRYILWIGIPLIVGATALTLFLSGASAGDPVWLRTSPAKHLTAPQKTKAVALATCVTPGLPVAQLNTYRCAKVLPPKLADGTQPDWTKKCTGKGDADLNDRDYVAAVAAGTVGPYLSRNKVAQTVKVPVSTGEIEIPAACLDEYEAFVTAVWPDTNGERLVQWFCARNPTTASVIDCESTDVVTSTPAAWLDAGGGQEGGPTLQGVVQ